MSRRRTEAWPEFLKFSRASRVVRSQFQAEFFRGLPIQELQLRWVQVRPPQGTSEGRSTAGRPGSEGRTAVRGFFVISCAQAPKVWMLCVGLPVRRSSQTCTVKRSFSRAGVASQSRTDSER